MNQQITHIGIVVNDLDSAARYWVEVLGFEETHRTVIGEEGVRTVMLSASGGRGDTAVELIEPIDKESMDNPIARHLAQKGEGFFHLAIIVSDLVTKEAILKGRGATVLQRPPATLGMALADIVDPGAPRLIVHPKCSNGIMIELLQRLSRANSG